MSAKKLSTKQMTLSLEIHDFAHDAYDYIWSQQTFYKKGVKEKFAEGYSLRCSLTDEIKASNFTECIGKAVRITQFLLRDYFNNFFRFTNSNKRVFKEDVKLMWSHWLDNRTNIFVKVIDTLAIIAEAFLFTDRCKNVKNLELTEMSEWFIEWFEEHLASEFFKQDGWKQLNNLALEWYDSIFESLKGYGVDLFYNPSTSKMVKEMYPCQLINYLRHSPVKFPVPERALCDKCKLASDKNLHRRTIYVRLILELRASALKTSFCSKDSPFKIQQAVETENLKDKQFVTKLEHNAESTIKDLPNVQRSQIDEIRKDYNVGNFEDFSSVQSSTRFTSISKTSFEGDSRVQKDFKSSIEDFSTENLSNVKHDQLETTSEVQLGLSSKKSSKNENLKSKQKIEILSDTFENLKLDSLTAGHQTEQPFDNEEEKDSSATSDVKKASPPSSVNVKRNIILESSPKQAKQVAEHFEQLPACDDSSASLPLLPDSVNLNQTFSDEHFLSSKKALETSQSEERISNKEALNQSFFEFDSYEVFREKLLQDIMQKDCQIEGSEDQNRLYLISDLFSNSCEKLFEALKTNTFAEKLKSINVPECAIPAILRGSKSEQQPPIPFDMSQLMMGSREYRFYFLGEEQTLKTTKRLKKRRS